MAINKILHYLSGREILQNNPNLLRLRQRNPTSTIADSDVRLIARLFVFVINFFNNFISYIYWLELQLNNTSMRWIDTSITNKSSHVNHMKNGLYGRNKYDTSQTSIFEKDPLIPQKRSE